MTGAAYVGWDGTYSFNVDGQRIPAERVAAFAYPTVQPSGLIEFNAAGSSTFSDPRYDVHFRMNRLAVAQEPVGLVTGTLALRGTGSTVRWKQTPRSSLTGTGASHSSPATTRTSRSDSTIVRSIPTCASSCRSWRRRTPRLPVARFVSTAS